MHYETPQQTVRSNAEVQTDPPQQPSTYRLTIRERLARSVQLRNQEREANIRTEEARALAFDSQRQYYDSHRRYYEIAAESHRLYNENVRLRNELLNNNRRILRARDMHISN